ncbi:CHAD domain-containing protein [Deltaproteobacteria bacterium TL4]
MTTGSTQFIIPANVEINKLKQELFRALTLDPEPSQTIKRTYYDSFDWRLYSKKGLLSVERIRNKNWLRWYSLDDPNPLDSVQVTRIPKMLNDIPESSLKTILAPILQMRKLLPQINLQTELHGFKITDDEGKTIVRLAIEENTLAKMGEMETTSKENRLIVLPVRGYLKPFERVTEVVDSLGILKATESDFVSSALKNSGVNPQNYASKPKLHFTPEMTVGDAVKNIMSQLMQIIELNESGTKQNIDSEFLHDFRVAIRRSRSAFTQLKEAFPSTQLEQFKTDFFWLGQVTGPTRDLDVYLLNFDGYQSSLSPTFQRELIPFLDFLKRHQQQEQRLLAKALNSKRYRQLKSDFHQFLESYPHSFLDMPLLVTPIINLANQRIWKTYKQALEEGSHIVEATSPTFLHELRKTCKKLRYLMEFFESLYPVEEIQFLVKELKTLQDNLGEFQDYEVQLLSMQRFAAQMMNEGEVPATALMSMGILVQDTEDRQHHARKEFSNRFARFSAPAIQERFKSLFKPQN